MTTAERSCLLTSFQNLPIVWAHLLSQIWEPTSSWLLFPISLFCLPHAAHALTLPLPCSACSQPAPAHSTSSLQCTPSPSLFSAVHTLASFPHITLLPLPCSVCPLPACPQQCMPLLCLSPALHTLTLPLLCSVHLCPCPVPERSCEADGGWA